INVRRDGIFDRALKFTPIFPIICQQNLGKAVFVQVSNRNCRRSHTGKKRPVLFREPALLRSPINEYPTVFALLTSHGKYNVWITIFVEIGNLYVSCLEGRKV